MASHPAGEISEWPKKRNDVYRHTFNGGEATVEDQLEITEVTLGKDKGRKSLGLGTELSLARQVAGEEILEDPAVGSVGHCVCVWVVEGEERFGSSRLSRGRGTGSRRGLRLYGRRGVDVAEHAMVGIRTAKV